MPTVLTDLREQRQELVSEIEALTSAEDFDPTDGTFAQARERAEKLDTKIKSLVEWESSRAAANEIDALSVRHRKDAEVQRRDTTDGRSPGEIFVRSKAYQDYCMAPRGTSGHVPIPLELFLPLQLRAPILTTTFAGILPPDRIAPSAPPNQQTPLLDVIPRVPVNSNSVEWVYFPAAGAAAAVTAEGVAKTETAVTPVLKTVTLETIASWLTVSRQMQEDGGAIMAYIDSAMRRGVVDKLESQAAAVLAADAGIVEVANPATGAGATDALSWGIRRAVGAVQAAGYGGGGITVVLNPTDYAAVDIANYGATLNGPMSVGTYWGARMVPAGIIPSGTAYVGDFSVGMALLMRSKVTMYSTDSHASNFVSNLITLLCEARAKAIVHRPEAIVKVKGDVTPAGLMTQNPAASGRGK